MMKHLCNIHETYIGIIKITLASIKKQYNEFDNYMDNTIRLNSFLCRLRTFRTSSCQ